MPKLNKKALEKLDASRDLNAELLDSIKDLKAGRIGRVSVTRSDGTIVESEVARVRIKTGLSQAKFALLLGVSPRTLQGWEQGRRKPTGAAKTVLAIAEKYPKVLRDLAA